MNIQELSKRKSFQVAVCILSILGGVYSVYDFAGMVRRRDGEAVAKEFNTAVVKLQKSPPGIERAELFIKQVKAIDPRYAPEDVKQALHDYIWAMEQGLNAMKAGTYTNQYDAETADAKERFIAAIKKCR